MDNILGVIYREAVHADRQGLLDILPNIFGGVDLVEDQCGELMEHKDFHHPYVAVIGDEIVGYFI